jgi:LysM repeat protein
MKRRTALLVLVVALLMGLLLATAGGASAAPARQWGQTFHVVRYGENLTLIATRYGVSIQAIVQANGLFNPNFVFVGQRLVIPGFVPPPVTQPVPFPAAGACTYVVRPGDNLTMIAIRYHTSVWQLLSMNAIANPNFIFAGQVLAVPCPAPAPPPPQPQPKPRPRPELYPAVCSPEVSIVSPKQNEHVRGFLYIIGTANIPDFQFYKVEYGMGEAPFEFYSISEVHRTPVVNGPLDVWYTDALPEGVYILRLTAVDNRGQFPPPCDVRVFIDRK